MNEIREIYRKQAESLVPKFARRNIEAVYCESAEDARELVLSMIPEGSTVTSGGSMTLEDAVNRVHNTAAPPNAARLNKKTPCAVTGFCGDCHGPDTICCQEVITRHSLIPGRIKIVLVGERLGF